MQVILATIGILLLPLVLFAVAVKISHDEYNKEIDRLIKQHEEISKERVAKKIAQWKEEEGITDEEI